MNDRAPQAPPAELDLPTVLSALADPARLAAVRAIGRAGALSCGQVQHVAELCCSKSTISHHLRVLREAGITETRVEGTRRFVSLRRAELEAAFPGLLGAVLTSGPQTETHERHAEPQYP